MPATIATDWMTGRGTAPGTCGELAQGLLPSGERFHVTCPINRSSRVTVRVKPSAATTVSGAPVGAWKLERALHAAARILELGTVEIAVQRDTSLSTAQGMASSTADIVAAARALAAATGQAFEPPDLARIATGIEASDGVMYDGIGAVDLDTGAVLRSWDWTPTYEITMCAPPERRETDSIDWSGQCALGAEYADLLAELDDAVANRDAVAFARQCTRSAWMNERFVANPLLPTLAPLAARIGADGLCVAHSGTVCGLLFSGEGRRERAQAAATDLLPHLPPSVATSLVHTPAS
jgi:L-threonine kinase